MNPYLNKKAIVSKRGQWDYPGQDTIVPTPDGSITMQGVNYPVYGQDETGYGQMMYPNKEYKFPGKMVYEKPMMAVGGITNANPVNPITPTEAEKRAKMLQIYNEELQKAKNKVSSEAFRNKFAYEGKMSGWNESEIEQERNNRIANYENIDYQYDNFNDVFTEQPGARGLIEPDLQYSKMAKIIDLNDPSKGYALSLEKQNKTKAGINPSLLQFENIARSAIQHEIGGHIGDVASPNDKSSLEYYGDNEGTPIYAPVWNHTPFALQTIKENTVPHPYYSMPTEVKAGKRQVENLLENAPIDKVNFGKTWKYGDDVSLEHFKYILNPQQYSDNPNEFKNEESDMMLKSIYGEDRVKKGRDFTEDEINEGYKKFKNLMILAQNQKSMSNNNTNPYGITARNGSMIKRADGSYSQRGLWDNIRANKGSGKKPTEQMLEQEKKIKQQEMGEGGYVVRKTDERKGKTHVVTGPDGTKKYFGDPNMGERGDSKLGKEAFYSRHADNLRDNPYFRAYARATWANGGEVNNPYIKAQYGTETLYLQGYKDIPQAKPVTIDGRQVYKGSQEYKDAYESGNLMSVDYDGMPVRYSTEEAVVTAEAPALLKQQREREKDPVAFAVREGRDAVADPFLEFSGIKGAARFAEDPMKNISGAGNVLYNFTTPGLAMNTYNYMQGKPFFDISDEDLQGLANTADVLGLAAPFVKPISKGLSLAPRLLGKVPRININTGLRFADESIDAAKALQRQRQPVLPESSMATAAKTVDDVTAKIPNVKEIEEITTYKNDLLNRLKTTEEGKRRLANFGLTPEDLNDIDLEFTGGGSKALPGKIDITGNPYVNVDFKQISQYADLGLTPMNTAAHEIGHALQYLAAKKRYSSGINPTDFKYSWKDLNKTPADQEILDWLTKNVDRSDEPFPGYFDEFPGIDKSLLKEKPKEGVGYLTTRAEPYAHLREFRTNMMDEGILKNEWDNVTEDMVDKFMNTSSNDRMKGFMKNTPDFRKRMSVLLNKYPAVIPGVIGTGATAAGASQLNQKRYGGETNPYLKARSGIYIKPENRGKFTAWAQNHDMGVQEAASKVMANKEEYSPSVVKMANFAKNAAGWKKGQDGLEANLPEAPTNMFSNYNPVSDDYTVAMTGMMKARMATDAEFGNNAAKRMTSLYPKTYTFTGNEMFYDEKVDVPAGATGTHYTTGDGNIMFPIIQEGQDGNLFFNRYANPYNKEAMRFESPQDASYFGENYKNIAPMMYNAKKGQFGLETTKEDVMKEIDRNIGYIMKGKEIPTGINMTKLSPNEEYTYQQWVKGLTPNLRENSEDKNYDMRGAWKTGEQPQLWDENFIPAHEIDITQDRIYEPHLFSNDPKTGRYLKGPNHESYMHAIIGDMKAGYTPTMDLKGNMYAKKMEKGGESDLVPVEVERSERIYDSKGNLLKEIPADAPTHEEGGVKLHLRPGTLVFPKKYYKKSLSSW